jgi:pyruvate/2-oxoglutarate dehydrogenase complex dihydrolipoamide dehydrogenase (E3) component
MAKYSSVAIETGNGGFSAAAKLSQKGLNIL